MAELEKKLTIKQRAFVREYLTNGYNGTQAAISAGYSKKTANVTSSEYLRKPYIKQYIEKHEKEALERFGSHFVNELDNLRSEVKRLKKLVGESSSGRAVRESNRYAVMHRAGFKCQCCGDKPTKNNDVKLHIDHIVPFSRGGDSEPENLQVLCSSCNIAKSNFYDFDHNEDWGDE